MPSKTRKASTTAETRPFAGPTKDAPTEAESTAPYAGLTEAAQRKVAQSIAADKAAGLSGNDLRAKYGAKLTGPVRRKVLRAHGFDGIAYIARSYDQYQDGDQRVGSAHAQHHGALAQARKAEAKREAEAELTAARKAKKGRTKAERAAYQARVDQAEAMLAALSA